VTVRFTKQTRNSTAFSHNRTYERRQKIFRYTHSTESSNHRFFRVYPRGATVLPTTARVSGIEFKSSVIDFILASNNINPRINSSFSFPSAFILPFSKKKKNKIPSRSFSFLRGPFPLLRCLQIQILPGTSIFSLFFQKSLYVFHHIFTRWLIVSHDNIQHASKVCKVFQNYFLTSSLWLLILYYHYIALQNEKWNSPDISEMIKFWYK